MQRTTEELLASLVCRANWHTTAPTRACKVTRERFHHMVLTHRSTTDNERGCEYRHARCACDLPNTSCDKSPCAAPCKRGLLSNFAHANETRQHHNAQDSFWAQVTKESRPVHNHIAHNHTGWAALPPREGKPRIGPGNTYHNTRASLSPIRV